MTSEIILVGDGILDNYFWLDNMKKDLKYYLNNRDFTTYNYAYDTVKLENLEKGITIKRNNRSYPYECENEVMYPLKLASRHGTALFSSADTNKLIVLSVGGNDLKNHLLKLTLGLNIFFNAVLTKKFIQEYEAAIINLKKISNKIVLISVYLPYLGQGSTYRNFRSFVEPVMNKWHRFIYKLALKYDLPVIDLSHTIDPYNRSNYGKEIIYLSNKSVRCVARCIRYVYNNYQGASLYYSKDGGKNITREDINL